MQDVLAGIRVVEVASWMFVPSAGAILAEWGADVVKIEHPVTGDPQRGLTTAIYRGATDVGFMFEIPNRGKRSVGLDIATEAGHELLMRLVEQADVFLTSFLPGVRSRLGIDVDDVRARNPEIVYARGSGMGPRGPEADRGGFDGAAFWARAGLAAAIQDPAADWPPEQRPALGDVSAGLALAGGIAAALVKRERTGRPSVVDASLTGTGLWMLAPDVTGAKLLEGSDLPPAPDRDARPNPAVGVYRTADGRFITLLMLQADRFWPDLCAHLERPDLATDPRFADAAARAANARECIALLREVFAGRTYADWCARFRTLAGVWAPMQSPLEVHGDPQVVANGYLEPITTASGAEFVLPANPVQFDETPPAVAGAPDHGAHTDEVLLELGLGYDEILEHKVSGAVL